MEVKPFTLEIEDTNDWDICRYTNGITSINFIWNCYGSKGGC
jgi:hypothetical protein